MDCWASVAYEDVCGLLNGQPAMRIAGVGFGVVVSPRNAVSALGQKCERAARGDGRASHESAEKSGSALTEASSRVNQGCACELAMGNRMDFKYFESEA